MQAQEKCTKVKRKGFRKFFFVFIQNSFVLQPSFNLYVVADDSAVYKPPPEFVKEEEEKAKKKKKKAPAKKKYCIEYQRTRLSKLCGF